MALTTLGFERDHSDGAGAGGGRVGGSWRQLLGHGAGDGRAPTIRATRQQLMRVLHAPPGRGVTSTAAPPTCAARAPAGPEGSLGKLLWTEGMTADVATSCREVLGVRLVADTGEWGTYGWGEHVLGAPGIPHRRRLATRRSATSSASACSACRANHGSTRTSHGRTSRADRRASSHRGAKCATILIVRSIMRGSTWISDCNGKRALVTGATKGIGRAIAETLLAEGASVSICARTADDVERRGRRAVGAGHGDRSARSTPADADSLQVVGHVVAARQLGGIDIYVHNTSGKPARKLEDWSKNFHIDLMALVHGVDAATEALADGGGSVISIGTTATAEHFASGSNSYSAFKSAVTNWTLGQAQVLGAKGVRCNVVSPGPIFIEGGDWDMHQAEHGRVLRGHREGASRRAARRRRRTSPTRWPSSSATGPSTSTAST